MFISSRGGFKWIFFAAWQYLCEHKIFEMWGHNQFSYLLNVDVVKVNPATLKVDDQREKNTLVQVWLEACLWLMPDDVPEDERRYIPEDGIAQHDIDLDCGAGTFEGAIIKLAELVKKKYD